jgi:hypothetical protein
VRLPVPYDDTRPVLPPPELSAGEWVLVIDALVHRYANAELGADRLLALDLAVRLGAHLAAA